MTTLIPTYTGSPTEQRLEEAKAAAQSNTGMVNPASVQQALAEQTFDNDQPLQQSIGQQTSALSAMDQLKEYDKQLASQVNQANKAQQQRTTNLQTQAFQMGAFDPNNAQATIAQGPAQFDTAQILKEATPTGLLSPFVAASLSSGQQQANTDQFDLASLARESRMKYLGGEVNALSNLFRSQLEAEQADKDRELALKNDEFNRNLKISQLTGSSFLDPFSGKTYDLGGKETNDKTAGVWSEMLSNANTEYDIWKQIDINQDALKASGVDVQKLWQWHKNLADRVGQGGNIGIGARGTDKETVATANQLRDEYIKQSDDFDKVSSSYSKILSATPTPAGDMSLIFGYMKMLDPGSTVREGEYANAENSAGIPERVRVQYNKALAGEKLGQDQRNNFKSEASNLYKATQDRHQKTVSEYERLASQLGVDPSLVIVDYGQINQPEKVRVRVKSTGQTGSVPMSEFDPNIYERI